jgi:hypothetical protein
MKLMGQRWHSGSRRWGRTSFLCGGRKRMLRAGHTVSRRFCLSLGLVLGLARVITRGVAGGQSN